MAKGDDIQRISETTKSERVQNSSHVKGSKARTSPTFQQLLQRDGSKWSLIASHINEKNHEQQDNGIRHNKKSVLAKVKEKAKKFKISLRGKKHRDTNELRDAPARSSGSVGPKDKGEEDAGYHSAQSNVSTSGMHLKKLNVKQSKDEHENFSKTKETHLKNEAPSNLSVVVADANTKNQTTVATTTDVSKVHEFPGGDLIFSGLRVSTLESSKNKSDKGVDEGENMKGETQTRDKGVSVKEYLMHKFEPGEDERALSKVITQTISPRRDKVRDAMSAFLKNEDSHEAKSSNVDNNVNLNLKTSKSLPATNSESKITPFKQSYSLGSNTSKASLNLNQTFKSTFASYQDHFLSSSSNHNSILNSSSSTNTKPGSNQPLNNHNSPTKSSSSPLGQASSANETQAPGSSAKKTRVHGHTATSVRRVPVSRANKTRAPISTASRIDANATRTPLSTGDQGRFRVS